MEYVIFGAGDVGRDAFNYLGRDRVSFFIDNYKSGEIFEGKEIYDFDYYLNYTEENILVVASIVGEAEILMQIQEANVKRFFVFRREHTKDIYSYCLYNRHIIMSLTEILAYGGINKYQKIALVGNGNNLPYVIAEIAFQSKMERILGVVYSDCRLSNERICDVPIITKEFALDNADCIVVCDKRENDYLIREELHDNHDVNVLDIYDGYKYISLFNHSGLKKYKNIHKGKRVFLIGNGPSLTIDDLNTLYENQEICFGTNKIYEIYDKTKWRANYICISDHGVMHRAIRDSKFYDIEETIFWADDYVDIEKKNLEKIHVVQEFFYSNYPRFSDDIVNGTYAGNTVLYDIAFQVAVYMGVSEIYLIGVDHNYSSDTTDKENHFVGYTYTEKEKQMDRMIKNIFNTKQMLERMNKSFEKAKMYCDNCGIKVFNTTRGGKLEVYPRVDFDVLFNKREI